MKSGAVVPQLKKWEPHYCATTEISGVVVWQSNNARLRGLRVTMERCTKNSLFMAWLYLSWHAIFFHVDAPALNDLNSIKKYILVGHLFHV